MDTQNSSAARRSGFSFYQRLFFLYGLNLTDWVCTGVLLSTGRFFEANPLMSPVVGSFWQTFLIKVVLPLLLVLLCAVVFWMSRMRESRFANVLLNIGIIAYSLVNLWHIVNFLLLFSAK